jgi:hypothetical protein
MDSFGIIAVSLLSIQILLLFMLMNIQSRCNRMDKDNMDSKESINNPWASPRKISLGGVQTAANSISDQPGIEEPLPEGSPEETIHSEPMNNGVLDEELQVDDPLADPDKKKSMMERLTDEVSIKDFSLSAKDDKYESEIEQEKKRAGKTTYDRSNAQDGDADFRTFKGANHFALGDPANTNTLNSKERLYNKTDGHLYKNNIEWKRGADLSNYRERLQMNRVDHMDPYPELDAERRPIVFAKDLKSEYASGDQKDPSIDNVAIEFILSEPRSNLRY